MDIQGYIESLCKRPDIFPSDFEGLDEHWLNIFLQKRPGGLPVPGPLVEWMKHFGGRLSLGAFHPVSIQAEGEDDETGDRVKSALPDKFEREDELYILDGDLVGESNEILFCKLEEENEDPPVFRYRDWPAYENGTHLKEAYSSVSQYILAESRVLFETKYFLS